MENLNFSTGKTEQYEVRGSLSMSEKTLFVMEVAEKVVSKELGYIPILKNILFDYNVLCYYTDIKLFADDEFSLDALEEFLSRNDTLMDDVKHKIDETELAELYNACGEAIEFRKNHFGAYTKEIEELLSVVTALVEKPDTLDELLKALTEWINTSAVKDIDMNMIGKLVNIIPIMQDMGNVEVAKAMLKNVKETDNVIPLKKKPGRPKKDSKNAE